MPWIDVTEPYAKPPRRTGPGRSPERVDHPDLDGQWAELVDIELDGTTIDLGSCASLEIRGCRFAGVRFENPERVEVEISDTEFVNCDLSRVRITTMNGGALTDCKLTGTDLSGGVIRDTRWTSSRVALTNMRMAKLERFIAEDCVFDETDFFDATLTDVAVPGSELREVNLDRAVLERVDFRDAQELGLTTLPKLQGAVVTPEQVLGLAFAMATALGVDIERDEAP